MLVIVGVIVTGAVGLLLAVLGWLVWKKQRITLFHEHHYAKVTPENRAAFCVAAGRGIVCIGVGLIVTAALLATTDSAWSFAAFAAGFAAGITMLIRADITYNR